MENLGPAASGSWTRRTSDASTEGDLFMGGSRDFLEGGHLFRFNLTRNRLAASTSTTRSSRTGSPTTSASGAHREREPALRAQLRDRHGHPDRSGRRSVRGVADPRRGSRSSGVGGKGAAAVVLTAAARAPGARAAGRARRGDEVEAAVGDGGRHALGDRAELRVPFPATRVAECRAAPTGPTAAASPRCRGRAAPPPARTPCCAAGRRGRRPPRARPGRRTAAGRPTRPRTPPPRSPGCGCRARRMRRASRSARSAIPGPAPTSTSRSTTPGSSSAV